jgi:glucokinase
MVQEFLSRVDLDVDQATFGVAGPVVNGRAKITNLPWVMDEQELRDHLGLSSVRLMNDLEAIANGVPALEGDDLHALHPVDPEPGGAIAVIAPGTGLGEAYLTWNGSRYLSHPSEGGHADFAPVNDLEIDLLRYLLDRFEHASYERVCSGKGIPNIYAYLRDSGHAEEPEWLAAELAAAADRTPVISRYGLARKEGCGLCVATMDAFVSILATEAGNLALKIMATGGVYLGGGIPRRILPALDADRFMKSFWDKGRMTDLLRRMPVHVIMNRDVALLGAACHCLGAERSDS